MVISYLRRQTSYSVDISSSSGRASLHSFVSHLNSNVVKSKNFKNTTTENVFKFCWLTGWSCQLKIRQTNVSAIVWSHKNHTHIRLICDCLVLEAIHLLKEYHLHNRAYVQKKCKCPRTACLNLHIELTKKQFYETLTLYRLKKSFSYYVVIARCITMTMKLLFQDHLIP